MEGEFQDEKISLNESQSDFNKKRQICPIEGCCFEGYETEMEDHISENARAHCEILRECLDREKAENCLNRKAIELSQARCHRIEIQNSNLQDAIKDNISKENEFEFEIARLKSLITVALPIGCLEEDLPIYLDRQSCEISRLKSRVLELETFLFAVSSSQRHFDSFPSISPRLSSSRPRSLENGIVPSVNRFNLGLSFLRHNLSISNIHDNELTQLGQSPKKACFLHSIIPSITATPVSTPVASPQSSQIFTPVCSPIVTPESSPRSSRHRYSPNSNQFSESLPNPQDRNYDITSYMLQQARCAQ